MAEVTAFIRLYLELLVVRLLVYYLILLKKEGLDRAYPECVLHFFLLDS